MRSLLLVATLAFSCSSFSQPKTTSERVSPKAIQLDTGMHEPIARLQVKDRIVGIVETGSTYVSQADQSTLKTIGTASLVEIAYEEKDSSPGSKAGSNAGTKRRPKVKTSLVALTAAHVVAGKNAWIKINGKSRRVKNSLLDNENDVAILELFPVAAEPALKFGKEGLVVQPKFMEKIDDGRIPTVLLAHYMPGHALGFALRPWVGPGVETSFSRSIVRAPIVSMNRTGEQIRLNMKVTSGASGSSVIDFREQRVAGLIVQSHYYLSETYLASPQVLEKLLNSYVSGARGTISDTSWKMKNGLVYRSFGPSFGRAFGEPLGRAPETISETIEEANFTNRPTSAVVGKPGAGVIGQPGAGVIGQPGAGVIGQPGQGVIGQPGNGVIGQPGDPANKRVSAFLPWSENPQAVFSYYKIKPGASFAGRPLIAIRAKAKLPALERSDESSWPREFTMLAESEAFVFMRDKNQDYSFAAVSTEQLNYVDELKLRLGITSSTSIRLETVFGPSAVANDFELQPDSKGCEVTIEKERVLVRVKTYARMDRKNWELIPDEIEFALNTKGVPEIKSEIKLENKSSLSSTTVESEFLPVIEVQSKKTGEIYFVDLRAFFFNDLSQLIRPMPDWSKDNPPFDAKRFDIKTQLSTASFTVRNASSGAEFAYGFVAPKLTTRP